MESGSTPHKGLRVLCCARFPGKEVYGDPFDEGLAARVYGYFELQQIELTFASGPVWPRMQL